MTATKDTVPITHGELADLSCEGDHEKRREIYDTVTRRHDVMYSRDGIYFQVQRRVGGVGIYIGVGDHELYGSAHEQLLKETIPADYRIVSNAGKIVERTHRA